MGQMEVVQEQSPELLQEYMAQDGIAPGGGRVMVFGIFVKREERWTG